MCKEYMIDIETYIDHISMPSFTIKSKLNETAKWESIISQVAKYFQIICVMAISSKFHSQSPISSHCSPSAFNILKCSACQTPYSTSIAFNKFLQKSYSLFIHCIIPESFIEIVFVDGCPSFKKNPYSYSIGYYVSITAHQLVLP